MLLYEGKGKSKVLIKFLLNFRQSGDVLFFLNVRRLRGYTATVEIATVVCETPLTVMRACTNSFNSPKITIFIWNFFYVRERKITNHCSCFNSENNCMLPGWLRKA